MRALAARGEKLEPELRERWQKNGRKTSGTWAQVFGDDEWGAEVFTAWHYARFAEALVKAGKANYDLPMFVNAALNRTGRKPGEYPSGGPLPHLLDVWKAGAPSVDFLAPDIYFPNFARLATRFNRPDNLLFIPEANNATNSQGPANAFFAFGELDTLGFSPFSIESLGDAPNALSRAYEVLEQLTPLILENRGSGRIAGFRATIEEDGTVIDSPVKKMLGGIEFTVTFIDPWTPRDKQTIGDHGGLLIHAGGEDFWFAGQGHHGHVQGRRCWTATGRHRHRRGRRVRRERKVDRRPPSQRRPDSPGAAHPTAAGAVPDPEGAPLPLSLISTRRRHQIPAHLCSPGYHPQALPRSIRASRTITSVVPSGVSASEVAKRASGSVSGALMKCPWLQVLPERVKL